MATKLELIAEFQDVWVQISVTQEWSRCGTPQPSVRVAGFARGDCRREKAVLHAIAALAELASPTTAAWVVILDENRVYLELDHDEPDAERGMSFLRELFAG